MNLQFLPVVLKFNEMRLSRRCKLFTGFKAVQMPPITELLWITTTFFLGVATDWNEQNR